MFYAPTPLLVIAAGWGLLGPLVLARFGNRSFLALTLLLAAIAPSILDFGLLSLGFPARELVRNLLPTSLPELLGYIFGALRSGFPFWASSLAVYLLKRSGRPTRVQCIVGATVAVLGSLMTFILLFPGMIFVVGGGYVVLAFWLYERDRIRRENARASE
jgi:hypothetical protein